MNENEQGILAVQEPNTSIMSMGDNEHKAPYCSMKVESLEDKKKLFNYINNPAKRISDCINEVIEIKDIYLAEIDITDKETGEVSVCPRTILISSDGQAYQAVSIGIFNAVRNMIFLLGEPTFWECPMPIKIKQITKGANTILTFEVLFKHIA